ncbi:Hypothetical predicted protein, partial [Mytilus galloprovincialis]
MTALMVYVVRLRRQKHVLANTCEDDKCITAIDIPLITKLNAPLKAELDISILTEQLKELITDEVKQAVSVAMKDLAEGIVDKNTQSALENLQLVNNQTISTFLKEMKDVTVRKSDLSTVEEKLKGEIKQMKEQQKLTELKLSSVKSDVTRSTERVSLLALSQQTSSMTGIIKFNDVKFSIGFNNLATFTNTGKIICEKSGLYMITVSIISSTTSTEFKIVLNGIMITRNRFVDGGQWHTGTTALVLQLHVGDKVW